uniref:Uncharacterized protein n=1 Tax=Ditylenchus dipsaci TaxID=166011 RepID=A0A915EAC6_9BILA
MSPQKVAQFVRTADVKGSSDVVLSRPLLRSVVFNSPSKQCSSRCLDFDSPSLSVSKQDAFNLLKTPSPMKKRPDTAEDGDEEFLGNDGVDVNNMEVTAFQPEAAKPKKQSRPRKSDGAIISVDMSSESEDENGDELSFLLREPIEHEDVSSRGKRIVWANSYSYTHRNLSFIMFG